VWPFEARRRAGSPTPLSIGQRSLIAARRHGWRRCTDFSVLWQTLRSNQPFLRTSRAPHEHRPLADSDPMSGANLATIPRNWLSEEDGFS
jgi:hypothetical protein